MTERLLSTAATIAAKRHVPGGAYARMVLLVVGWMLWKTNGLFVPHNFDPTRGAAFAQTVLLGRLGSDANYPGELMWHSPLVACMEALLARTTGLSVGQVVMRLGPLSGSSGWQP